MTINYHFEITFRSEELFEILRAHSILLNHAFSRQYQNSPNLQSHTYFTVEKAINYTLNAKMANIS